MHHLSHISYLTYNYILCAMTVSTMFGIATMATMEQTAEDVTQHLKSQEVNLNSATLICSDC